MKSVITIAVSYEKVTTIVKELMLPEVAKYFKAENQDRIFSGGLVLFGIIPKYPGPQVSAYRLIQITRNEQSCTDFIPKTDCKNLDWLKESGLRRTAFDIMQDADYDFKEISELEFDNTRMELLNSYKN